MPDKTVEALALIQAQAQAREQLVGIAQAGVRAEVSAFAGWYSSAQITSFAGRLAKLVRAGQKQTATSTDAYSLRILTLMTGRRPRSRGPVPVDDLWGGVPLESVFGRLADNYRWLESKPVQAPDLTSEAILERVTTRAEVQADTALTLAFREQWLADLDEAPTVTGYRRVIHPELSTGGTCGLCAAASTMVYKRAELLPIHARCHCTVAPIVGDPHTDGDPGSVINEDDLARLYKDAGSSTKGRDLKKTRYRVAEHGELGPVLVNAADQFRGPDDVPAAA